MCQVICGVQVLGPVLFRKNHLLLHVRDFGRFRNKGIHSNLLAHVLVELCGIRGYGADILWVLPSSSEFSIYCFFLLFPLPKLQDTLDAVHHVHIDIHENHIVQVFLHHLETLLAVHRCVHRFALQCAEDIDHEHADERVVLHQQARVPRVRHARTRHGGSAQWQRAHLRLHHICQRQPFRVHRGPIKHKRPPPTLLEPVPHQVPAPVVCPRGLRWLEESGPLLCQRHCGSPAQVTAEGAGVRGRHAPPPRGARQPRCGRLLMHWRGLHMRRLRGRRLRGCALINGASLKRTGHWCDGVSLAHYNDFILLHWCCSFLFNVACAGTFLRNAAWGRMHFCSNIRNRDGLCHKSRF
mmetsp:Transcript_18930/g.36124  ORF Transcript_18930/g.36124 Transcript_18930/m.36124 type:complete len:353 (-) Transcript_18930:1247-2305(-)